MSEFFSRLREKLKKKLWTELDLHQKLALTMWLTVVPISLGAATWALHQARVRVDDRLRQELIWDVSAINNAINNWEMLQVKQLQLLAFSAQLDRLNAAGVRNILLKGHALFPNYSFFYISQDGRIAESVGPMLAGLGSHGSLMSLRSQFHWPSALQIKSQSLLVTPTASTPCLATTVSLLASPTSGAGRGNGLLGTCLQLDRFGWLSGAVNLIKAAAGGNDAVHLIDLDDPSSARSAYSRGWAALMVYPNGEFIELDPNHKSVDQVAHLDVAAIKSSPWQPLISAVLNSRRPSELTHVVVDGIHYSVAIIKNRSGRRSVVLVDDRSATFLLNTLSRSLLLGFAIALVLVSALVYRICGQLSRPIDQVGRKLAAISQGEFGDPLPEEHNDLGRLFGYVNQASQRLQDYLVESNHHAALDAQLVEARRIQAGFLIKNLPCTDRLDIASFYEPAYEIGADWYDAILIDGVTFVVVADVCDKGIPSALYMSVFRSLLRLALGNEWEASHNAHQTLAKAMVVVNEYMVSNHGSTGMFATVFVSAYDPSQQELYYVVAGHEQPLLLQGRQLSQLELGGPAVGIFGGSPFHVHHSRFLAGDLLLAFTDGLPDGRSPVGVGFGNHRIVEFVTQRSSLEWTPSQLLEKLIEAQNCHRDGAEQFDDLTLLSIQAR